MVLGIDNVYNQSTFLSYFLLIMIKINNTIPFNRFLTKHGTTYGNLKILLGWFSFAK